ncbi:hypothetical protein EUTSA_v10004647mg [Eutrema salsugineum]|uniref:2-C-methyl-D-erythritol 4-phosphate cytidylyltransferase, chloroplastic n=1 Tax=Eutrema salsugineum TaxID=72664 RepID=V4K681_EUTSA|nr:hypothetical protein EUTSA_v10004647mg [Eutrema salsugineum]
MAMLQANLGFVKSPTFPFSSSSFSCPKIAVKATSASLGFKNRSSVQRLDFSKRVSRIYRRDALLLSIKCSSSAEFDNSNTVVKEKSVSVILLAGGQGKRMKMSMPKQYIPLLGQPIALYSFFTFSRMPEVKEIVVVCDPFFRDYFGEYEETIDVDLKFALPGKERQDSVHSGLQEIDVNSELVCIHDSARPLVDTEDVKKVLKDGLAVGAAVLGVPAKATIKEVNSDSLVVKTLDRKTLWEMQTPQVIKPELLKRGFELVKRFVFLNKADAVLMEIKED